MTRQEIEAKISTIRNNNALPEKQKGMLLDKYERMLVDATIGDSNAGKIAPAKEKKARAPRTPKPKTKSISLQDFGRMTGIEVTDMTPKVSSKKEVEPDCDDLFEQDRERKAKAAIAAEKRRNAPKKTEATKNTEAVEKASAKVEKSVEKRIKSGDVSVAEIKKIIEEYETALKKLRQLLTRAEGKMKFGGPVKDQDISKLADKARDISNHHCGCNDKHEDGGSMYAPGGNSESDNAPFKVLSPSRITESYLGQLGNSKVAYVQPDYDRVVYLQLTNGKVTGVNFMQGGQDYLEDSNYEWNAPSSVVTEIFKVVSQHKTDYTNYTNKPLIRKIDLAIQMYIDTFISPRDYGDDMYAGGGGTSFRENEKVRVRVRNNEYAIGQIVRYDKSSGSYVVYIPGKYESEFFNPSDIKKMSKGGSMYAGGGDSGEMPLLKIVYPTKKSIAGPVSKLMDDLNVDYSSIDFYDTEGGFEAAIIDLNKQKNGAEILSKFEAFEEKHRGDFWLIKLKADGSMYAPGGGIKDDNFWLDEIINTPWGEGRIYEISGKGSDKHAKIDIKGKTYIMNMGEIDEDDIVKYAGGGGTEERYNLSFNYNPGNLSNKDAERMVSHYTKDWKHDNDLDEVSFYVNGLNKKKVDDLKEELEMEDTYNIEITKSRYARGGAIKIGDRVKSTTFKGISGTILSKNKAGYYFVRLDETLPNGDYQHEVLRIDEVEKMSTGGSMPKGWKHKMEKGGDVKVVSYGTKGSNVARGFYKVKAKNNAEALVKAKEMFVKDWYYGEEDARKELTNTDFQVS